MQCFRGVARESPNSINTEELDTAPPSRYFGRFAPELQLQTRSAGKSAPQTSGYSTTHPVHMLIGREIDRLRLHSSQF
jgi:hypothetical protein